MEFSPDGRLFTLEQAGNVRLIRNDGTSWLALHLNVDSSGERGLLGIAFDPNFAVNHYAYLDYTNPNPGAAAWAVGEHNQLSRFTVDDSNPSRPVFTNEAPILDWNSLSTATNHNGGAIHFGIDGMLYADAGDNVQTFVFNGVALRVSQSLGSLLGKQLRINVAAFNAGIASRDDATVGHLIPADNPFVGVAPGINQLIYALGFRNPYTFAVQPGTGTIFVNDVGESTWEEIDRVIPGGNYGWSGDNTDGFGQVPPGPGIPQDPALAYNHFGGPAGGGAGIVGGAFYNPAGAQFPSSYLGKYFYGDLGNDWIRLFDPSRPGSASIPDTSQPFASGTVSGIRDLKVDAAGSLYYLAAGNGGVVERISYTASGLAPQITSQPQSQATFVGQSVTFTVGASGPSLSYQWRHLVSGAWINIGTSTPALTITNAQFSDGGAYSVVVSNPFGVVPSVVASLVVNPPPTPPVIVAQPVNQVAATGESATFRVNVAGTTPFTYVWQHFVGTGWTRVGLNAPVLTVGPLTAADAGYYMVVVGNAGGVVASRVVTLTVNARPVPQITLPVTGQHYHFGQVIPFVGTATDPEEGPLPANRLFWIVQFIRMDRPDGTGLQTRTIYVKPSSATGVFSTIVYDTTPYAWYRVILGAVDSLGNVGTTFVDVLPSLTRLTLASSPPGITLLLDGLAVRSGYAFESVVGLPHAIGALASAHLGTRRYAFQSWSDGGAAVHMIVAPATSTTYQARYVLTSTSATGQTSRISPRSRTSATAQKRRLGPTP